MAEPTAPGSTRHTFHQSRPNRRRDGVLDLPAFLIGHQPLEQVQGKLTADYRANPENPMTVSREAIQAATDDLAHPVRDPHRQD